MKILNHAKTLAALPYTELARAIAATLKRKTAGIARAPDRSRLPLAGDALLLTMPAADDRVAMVKLVTVHPDNPARGLPTIQGEVVVMDAETGVRIAVLDGVAVTARRTAALSLLAAQALAPERGPLLIVGAGAQGRAHLEAFHLGMDVREVHVASRSRESAEALAGHARSLGIAAYVARSVRDVVRRTPLIVTTTTSKTPVLPEELPGNAFVAAVGAHTPDMAELPPALLASAQVYVDTKEGALKEAGDLIQAGMGEGDVAALEDMLDGPRPTHGPVVFKSTGHALFDLAAARLACGME